MRKMPILEKSSSVGRRPVRLPPCRNETLAMRYSPRCTANPTNEKTALEKEAGETKVYV
ncbi:MAG: hypothetical protein MZV64_09720 [Ignavibacteriales bacterium]|nr:hypothetical protein [Ignavibacteriales bacterium]